MFLARLLQCSIDLMLSDVPPTHFYNESNLHADSPRRSLEILGDSDFGFVHQVLTFSRVRDDSLTSFSQSYNTYLPYGRYTF